MWRSLALSTHPMPQLDLLNLLDHHLDAPGYWHCSLLPARTG